MKVRKIISKDTPIVCSFCRRSQHEVAKMVSDPTGKVFICDQCIKTCHKVVSEVPDRGK